MLLRFIFFIGLVLSGEMHAQKIKVACVGNSVTYGAGIEKREVNSYPAQLQQLLGDKYEVSNFGHSGATMLKNGHKPYWIKEEYNLSKEFEPNIVILHLGLNDQGNNNWPNHKDEFVTDYSEMISVYENLDSKPKVFICRMTPTFSGHHWFEEGMRENFNEIQYKIESIAKSENLEIIDLHEPLYRFPEYFPDNIHPTKEGAAIIANKVFNAITGDFGGLKLPRFYGENMVFQRNESIVISGNANSNDNITVFFNNQKISTRVAKNSTWKVVFPEMKAGGPYSLNIKSELSEDIAFKSVYIGDVWLASGQSNMDFKLSQIASADTVLKDSINPNIFIYSMDPKVLRSGVFTKEDLSLLKADNYFEHSGWSNGKSSILENFSGVAYSFAYNLQKELNVPIGIICNAVGGAPIESWISRESMEQSHETISLLNDTWQNPMTDSWVSKRKSENFNADKNLDFRHPYDPTFLFDSGILPLVNFNMKGVIWYQGESNTEHVNLHTRMFKMLVKDWRRHFNTDDLPFYYVQLSSINRPNWGAFRNSQRELLEIRNTGMAVSLDVGDFKDVHPKQKWVVGKRLANVALFKTYKKQVVPSGPLFDFVNILNNKLEVYFKNAEGLKTIDGDLVKDIEIAGENKVFVKAQTKIYEDRLIVWSKAVEKPRFVRYGYSSYTDGNLVNIEKFPASTFSNLRE